MILIASVFAVACSSPTGPTSDPCANPLTPGCGTDHTIQPPTENGFEPLGTRHYLRDENGNATPMWAELTYISPLRGSKIVYAPFKQQPDCNIDCYSVTVKFGIDADASRPGGTAGFQAGWNMTENGTPLRPGTPGLGLYTYICPGGAPNQGGEGTCSAGPKAAPGGGAVFTTFEFPARLLTVIGQYDVWNPNGGLTVKTGKTSFDTGYQPLN
jgi:hypothetical protein